MDWIGDKLAKLIEDGKRALGTEVVVSSDAPEDEVDDGSGNWVEDEPIIPSSSSRPIALSSPRKRAAYSHSPAHARYATDSVLGHGGYKSVPATPLPSSRFDFENGMTPSPSLFSRSYQDGLNKDEEASDSVREAMERARAAYRTRRAGASGSGLGYDGQGL